MVRALKQTVTIGEGGRIEIPTTDLPAGRMAEVTVVVQDAVANGVDVVGDEPSATFDAEAYLDRLRAEWQRDEETKRPISYYFGKGKGLGGFKDAAEADAFIRAERDSWDE